MVSHPNLLSGLSKPIGSDFWHPQRLATDNRIHDNCRELRRLSKRVNPNRSNRPAHLGPRIHSTIIRPICRRRNPHNLSIMGWWQSNLLACQSPSLMASRWTRGPDKSLALQPICRNGLLTRYGPTTQEGDFTKFPSGLSINPQIRFRGRARKLTSNESAVISPYYSGPPIEIWEVSPALPSGLQLSDDGTIEGVPDSRTDWSEYTIWK